MKSITIKNTINELNERRSHICNSIESIQKVCENSTGHDYEYTGHNSNKSRYECNFCGNIK